MSVLTLPASFHVGIAELDDDHVALFSGLNALHDAALAGNRRRAGQLVTDIGQLAADHFEREEALLAAHRYPLLFRHADGHERVFRRLREVARRVTDPDWRGLADAVEGLFMLKLEGLMIDDMDYRWWFAGCGVDAALTAAETKRLPRRQLMCG